MVAATSTSSSGKNFASEQAGDVMAGRKKGPSKNRRWIAKVKTVSTFPPEGLFTKSASTIARSLASKEVSPKGPGSGMRMLTYFINRAGRGLSPTRRRELEKAKALLSRKVQQARKKKVA
jgi:tRNA(adenine34) deaminase